MLLLINLLSVLLQILHRKRVAFGFTLYDHCVFGVHNMLLHGLLYDSWGLSDCRQRNKKELRIYLKR